MLLEGPFRRPERTSPQVTGTPYTVRQTMRLIETDPSLEKILPHPAAGGRESPDPVLLHHDPGKVKGEIIGKLASSCCHVRSSARMVELADALKDREDLLYIGVTDDEDRALGLIIRREFFSVLGQPYGRDLYRDKSVLRLMKETGAFNFYTNLFSVTDLLAPVLHEKQIRYYPLRRLPAPVLDVIIFTEN